MFSAELRNIAEDFDPNADPADKVRSAQELILAATEILEDVANETNNDHAKAYIVDHLKVLASSNHGFLSRDTNLDNWIEKLES